MLELLSTPGDRVIEEGGTRESDAIPTPEYSASIRVPPE